MISNKYTTREIKFAAMCSSTGEWIYGLPKESVISSGTYYISQFCREKRKFDKTDIFIMPETLVQFTGLKDKNGKEIYEGHILKGNGLLFVVTIDCFGVNFLGDNNPDHSNRFDNKNIFYSEYDWEIIGNIYQNKEILEARND
jgi:uncharacterized phage protein (TIGR01671 family)